MLCQNFIPDRILQFLLGFKRNLKQTFTYDTRNWQARKHDIAYGPGRLATGSFIIPQRPFLFLLLLNVDSSLLERIWQHIPLTIVNEKNIKYTCLRRWILITVCHKSITSHFNLGYIYRCQHQIPLCIVLNRVV
jgi:hypothetical protein